MLSLNETECDDLVWIRMVQNRIIKESCEQGKSP
jgi:hypothetical protein